MTREDAILCLKGIKNYGRDTFTEQSDWQESLDMAIKALEQEPKTKIEESNFSQEQYLADIQSAYDCGKAVIDKIRAEIIELRSRQNVGVLECLDIIDKYKAESEDI